MVAEATRTAANAALLNVFRRIFLFTSLIVPKLTKHYPRPNPPPLPPPPPEPPPPLGPPPPKPPLPPPKPPPPQPPPPLPPPRPPQLLPPPKPLPPPPPNSMPFWIVLYSGNITAVVPCAASIRMMKVGSA